jgi:DNA (cytosine-5)-methyltransferase 1
VAATNETANKPVAVGLFAGIGGIELGLAAHFETKLLCEVDAAAKAVLEDRFPAATLHDDVRGLDDLPAARLVAAGFPCTDLSQAGRTAGIGGEQSGLVEHVFRLLDAAQDQPEWLLLENVPFMLALERGDGMAFLVQQLSERGWRWAYRVVDTRAFGLPQRRRRVLLLASRESDPRPALFGDEAEPGERELSTDSWCGFYWTEGLRGLGWAVDAVPTLKGGSSLGIPSPPGIWKRETGEVGTPDIRDAERLQGFPADWTLPAVEDASRRNSPRWKLVGNAVSVPVAEWVGGRVIADHQKWTGEQLPLTRSGAWPSAAWGDDKGTFVADVSTWPRSEPFSPLRQFLGYETTPLSHRAAAGFLERTQRGNLKTFAPGFLDDVAAHVDAMAASKAA